jgi:hypothetical protein
MLSAVLLACALIWLGTLTLSATRVVRARNAFMLRRGRAKDFEWTPATVPAGFRLECVSAPDAIIEAVEAAGVASLRGDWQRSLALVSMLIRHARDDGGIQADLATTYRHIVRGRGYCVDYVRVYMAAAATVGLFCRQWAFSLDGFGGHGHTFVEIYDRDAGRWAFIDVHNNVYAIKAGAQTPLDAIALRTALLAAPNEIEFRPAVSGRLGYPHLSKLVDYYRAGAREWYLVWGNDVSSRERRGIAGILLPVSGRLAYRLGSSLVGIPPLVAIVTPENETAMARMEALRRSVFWALALVAALACSLAVQLGFGMGAPDG